MKRSYVQNESFKNNLFQYIFARWNHRTMDNNVARRHEHRFKAEINMFLEVNDKDNFKFTRARDKILFQFQRILLWISTLIIFAGAITALYFTNRYTFQVEDFYCIELFEDLIFRNEQKKNRIQVYRRQISLKIL